MRKLLGFLKTLKKTKSSNCPGVIVAGHGPLLGGQKLKAQ